MTAAQAARRAVLRGIDALLLLLLTSGFASLVLEYGLLAPPEVSAVLHRVDLGIAGAFLVLKIVKLLLATDRRAYFVNRWLDYALLFVLGIQLVVFLLLRGTPEFRLLQRTGQLGALSILYLTVLQVGLLLAVALKSPWFHSALVRLHLRPAQSLLVSYLAAVLAGAAFLALPGAGAGGRPLTLLEALFTSTSAVCVTGLSVIDVGTRLSVLGQWVLLVLIQVGGVGILTFTALLANMMGTAFTPEEKGAVAAALEVDRVQELGRLVRRVAGYTFVLELIGAAALYIAWAEMLPGRGGRVHLSIFHAVSAFCNAGFSLFPDSLVRFAGDVPVNLVIGLLIVAGGIGFSVLSFSAHRSGRLLLGLESRPAPELVRVVVWASAILIVVGALLFGLSARGVLAGLGTAEQVLASLFQSVTFRTAGFNTVPFEGLGVGAAIVAMVWMWIGGSPGSTAGGVKTTTAAVLFSALFLRRRLPGMEVRPATIWAAVRLAAGFTAVLAVAAGLLWLLESRTTLSLAFEALSALGTVGLSMGETTRVGHGSLVVLMAAMLVGRAGPVVVGLALWKRAARPGTGPSERPQIRMG